MNRIRESFISLVKESLGCDGERIGSSPLRVRCTQKPEHLRMGIMCLKMPEHEGAVRFGSVTIGDRDLTMRWASWVRSKPIDQVSYDLADEAGLVALEQFLTEARAFGLGLRRRLVQQYRSRARS